jgi:hypothetical protein
MIDVYLEHTNTLKITQTQTRIITETVAYYLGVTQSITTHFLLVNADICVLQMIIVKYILDIIILLLYYAIQY